MGALAESFKATGTAPVLPQSDPGGTGLFGWIGNLGGDIKELGMGLGALVASGVHDVGRGVAQAIPGQQNLGILSDNPADAYRMDDILLGLPGAIVGDYARRYGGASNIAQGLYEDPLAYLLDIVGVGALAGKGASIAGRAAVKGSEVASEAAAYAARDLAEAAAKNLVPISGKAANLASTRAGLEALGQSRPLTALESISKTLLPKSTFKLEGVVEGGDLIGGKFVPTVETLNPATRALLTPARKLMTRPISRLEQEIGVTAGEMAETYGAGKNITTALKSELTTQQKLLTEARELGLSRIERPSVARLNAELGARRLMTKLKGEAFTARRKATAAYEQVFKPYVRDPAFVNQGAHYLMRTDVQVPGFTRAEFIAKQTPDIVPEPIAIGRIPGPIDQVALKEAAMAVEPIAKRVDAVVGKLQRYTDELNSNPSFAAEKGIDVAAETSAANRLMDRAQRMLIRKGRIERGDLVMPELKAMNDDTWLVDMEKMVDQFTSGTSAPSMVLEETYAPLRLAHGADWDDDLGRFVGGPDTDTLDDAFAAMDEPGPTYFPFIDPEKAKASDWFPSKQKVGANIYARDPHAKRMKGTRFVYGEYERNPMEALVRRAARGSRAQETYRLFQQITTITGKPILSTDDIPPGYEVVAPDLAFLHINSGTKFGDDVDRLIDAGMEPSKAIVEAWQSVTLKNQEKIVAILEQGNVKMWAVPKVVADRLNDAARYAGFLQGKGRLTYDSITAGWRALVLSGSPRWVINNFLGNTVFAGLQGVKTADVVKLLGANFKEMLGGRSKVLEELRKIPGFEDVASTGFVGSATSMYEPLKPALKGTWIGRGITRAGESRAMSIPQKFGAGMKRLNATVEDAFREASYLTALEKQAGVTAARRVGRSFLRSDQRVGRIMADGGDEARYVQALEEVNRFFGDYSALGPFERHVMRRFIAPFWGFYKHQGKLLMRFPFESPLKAQVLRAFSDVNREMMDQYGELPDWLEGAIPFGPPGGEVEFFSSIGPNPFNASFQDPTSMLSPAIKMFWEQATGKNVFSGRPFSDPNVFQPYGSDQFFRKIYDEQGNVVDVVEVAAPKPNLLYHALGQIPQFNALAEAIAGGANYDTAPFTALPDYETGEPRYPTSPFDELLALSGVGTTPYDVATYQQRQEELRKAALTQAQNQENPGG